MPRKTTKLRGLQVLRETGASGLEHATSGVTDHFSGRSVHNNAHASALLMRFSDGLRPTPHDDTKPTDTFAAHLLPGSTLFAFRITAIYFLKHICAHGV